MKILIPHISKGQQHRVDSDTVFGGLQMFVKNIVDVLDYDIQVLEITEEDRENSRTKKTFLDTMWYFEPDLIITNDIDRCFVNQQINNNIPTIAIMHEPLVKDVRYLEWAKHIQKFIDAGGHLYFVSKNQQKFFEKFVHRVSGNPLTGVKGLIHSSFAYGNETVSKDINFDAATIGRTDVTKNPFILHKKLQHTDLTSCVITNQNGHSSKEAQTKYISDNSHWDNPQYTFRGLNHKETLKLMASSHCFVSTMTSESWGITSLEALTRGLPVILLCDKTNEHSSELIPVDTKHYRKVSKNIEENELADVIKEFSKYSYEDRIAISEATKKKHSREDWKKRLEFIIEERINDKKEYYKLFDYC